MSRNIAAALAHARAFLSTAGSPSPEADAVKLVEHATGLDRVAQMMHADDLLTEAMVSKLASALAQRAEGRPVAQIIGWRMFYGRRFQVTEATLDPRPETELLVEQALCEPFDTVLDLGTGTGCILLSILAEARAKGRQVAGIGTDLSQDALGVARSNTETLNIQAGFAQGDWWDALDAGAMFDLIVSNPPYIAAHELVGLERDLEFEPLMALSPGADGLAAYRVIAAGVARHLSPNGRVMVEIGWTQGHNVAELFTQAGLTDVEVIQDLDHRDRLVSARKCKML